jgi:hypothetical protein
MSMVNLPPGASGVSEAVSQAQKLVEQTPGQVQEFQQLLDQLDKTQNGGGLVQQAANQPPATAKVEGPERAQQLYLDKLDEAREPEGVRKLLGEVEAGTQRLDSLLGELNAGRTFSTQELIGIQAEIQHLSLQVETTSRVVSEVVSNVKNLLQQQI